MCSDGYCDLYRFGRVLPLLTPALLVGSRPPAAAQEPRPYQIVFDRGMTPAAGTTDLLTLGRAVDLVVDPLEKAVW